MAFNAGVSSVPVLTTSAKYLLKGWASKTAPSPGSQCSVTLSATFSLRGCRRWLKMTTSKRVSTLPILAVTTFLSLAPGQNCPNLPAESRRGFSSLPPTAHPLRRHLCCPSGEVSNLRGGTAGRRCRGPGKEGAGGVCISRPFCQLAGLSGCPESHRAECEPAG